MNSSDVIDIARDTIFVTLQVGGPILLIALVVGLIISLFQALTQIQEQTLVFVPKIIAIFLVMLIALPFMGATLSGYMTRLADMIVTGG